ncbi:SDR family NAD(P)-dependent oxidoreductase [Bacillus xiapuensis]|uniref:SDR family NAD(P)-dependent oxidoreductase n=1 Tax=Bacillus xiapuensis TaxID=2014075 RepID=UPI000C236E50|nr:SDR family NAD(P)-dependent oxidoreductase [Bacillus xiapuensis]
MKKALVAGASGGMGYAIVEELNKQGIETIAFARTKEKLDALFSAMPHVEVRAGDVFRLDDLLQAAEGADVIYHAVNIPYPMWQSHLERMTRNIIETAASQHCRLAIADNIYAYGQGHEGRINEKAPKQPHTKKGRLRLQAEELISRSGIPAVRAHFPDFYGPNAISTVMHSTLKNGIQNKRAVYVGDMSKQREFIYTPDGAKALIELSRHETAYGRCWNIPGAGTISGHELRTLLEEITGHSHSFFQVNKGMIRLLSLFNKEMKEVVEMMYLYEQPVILSGEAYEKEIGPLPQTPYDQGLKKTIQFMKKAESL